LDRFIECWDGLEDPRTGNAALHDFHEILVISLCAVLCGGQGSVDMGLFAKAKEPFLRGFLELENGVPSHDTFSRLFRLLDAEQFRAAFQRFMAGFSEQYQGVVAIDCKVLRRSHYRPFDFDVAYDFETRVGPLRFVEKGVEIDLLTQLSRGGQCDWESTVTYYFRGRFANAPAQEARAPSPDLSEAAEHSGP
jgi:hypothetical protein